jgi:hypothetical protein
MKLCQPYARKMSRCKVFLAFATAPVYRQKLQNETCRVPGNTEVSIFTYFLRQFLWNITALICFTYRAQVCCASYIRQCLSIIFLNINFYFDRDVWEMENNLFM